MAKINQEEYEVLKELDDKWEWIARDKDGTLIIFAGEAIRYSNKWYPPENVGDSITVDELNAFKEITDQKHFQFIQWEDEEPYEIAELIEEYENSPEYVTYISNERTRILSNDLWSKLESEETEVKKDLNWFKEKLELLKEIDRKMWEKSEPNSKNQSHFNGSMATIDKVLDFLSQLDEPVLTDDLLEDTQEVLLQTKVFQHEGDWYKVIKATDEPEVLSQEFIDKYKVDYDNWMPAVPIVHLQNLLVPKQELPVIPQYVAEWIEETKPNNSLRVAFEYIAQRKMTDYDDELAFWVEEGNSETFARAWLDGYEVEEEQKYVIKLDDESYLQRYEIESTNIITPFRIVGHLKEVAIKFDNKKRAEKVAELVEGKVEELKE